MTLLKFQITLFFLLIFNLSVFSQNFTNSNLPIVVITTEFDTVSGNYQNIPDEPKIWADMKIIFRPDGSRNYLTDIDSLEFLSYDGKIGIELRGSTSQTLIKKPYALFTLNSDGTKNNVEILGMAKENNWILHSFAYDSTYLRDPLINFISSEMGNWASDYKYCELVVNNNYKGLYAFAEKIKIDKKRVNIKKLSEFDNELPDLSGGYIIKADKTTGGDPIAWTMETYSDSIEEINYIHHRPKPVNITDEQHEYIKNYFTAFQEAMDNNNTSILGGYPSMIDIPSFIDFIICNELSSNVDAYVLSTFFFKDRNSKLCAGPIWDFNLSFGNDFKRWNNDRSKVDVWQFDFGATGSEFWLDLFNDEEFNCYLTKRWKELRFDGEILSYDNIETKIDSISELIAESLIREEQRWGSVGIHQTHVDSLKTWLVERLDWMDQNLTDCEICAEIEVPKLVINKIHYHPKEEFAFDKDDLEFIEIINNSEDDIDLTGIYFKETGFVYRFPDNYIASPFESFYIVSNAEIFEEFYGFTPFGQFTRHLSNKSFDLCLVDAFGNIINQVIYEDSYPWPELADGDGPYLSLINPDLDNSLAENWVATDALPTDINNQIFTPNIFVYPNPCSNICIVESEELIKNISLQNISGLQVLNFMDIKSYNYSFQVSDLSKGVYILITEFENDIIQTTKLIVF